MWLWLWFVVVLFLYFSLTPCFFCFSLLSYYLLSSIFYLYSSFLICSYLTEIGHTQPKSKAAGQDKFFLAVGYRKANDKDKLCPIAGRVHKSNTQKYTVFIDTQVMQQGCWDSACQETGKHVYYQIQGSTVINCGWVAPPPPQQVDSSGKQLAKGSKDEAPAFNNAK